MTDLRTAAQQALTILEAWKHKGMWGDWDGVTDALKAALVEDAMQKFTDVNQELEAALAEPVQEPVAWFHTDFGSLELSRVQRVGWKPLYAAPPQRKPLTEEEIDSIWDSEKAFADIYAIARAIERAHGIKE